MNILVNQFPDFIVADGIKIHIQTDFRYWLDMIISLESETSSQEIKIQKICAILPDNVQPTQSIIDALVEFMNCGSKLDDGKQNVSKRRLLSYEKDQYLIYVDFIHFYNIDLSIEKLHWWQFKNLLLELPDEAKIKKAIFYRGVTITSKMSKEQRKFYTEMKRVYSLDTSKTKMNNAGAIGAAFMRGIKKH